MANQEEAVNCKHKSCFTSLLSRYQPKNILSHVELSTGHINTVVSLKINMCLRVLTGGHGPHIHNISLQMYLIEHVGRQADHGKVVHYQDGF